MTKALLSTLSLDTQLDVQARLRQLDLWQAEWRTANEQLNDRMRQLDHSNHFDIQRGAQLA